jgi:hypothetical protein
MKATREKILLLPMVSLFTLFNGCTSSEVISVSESHLYNGEYGIIQNYAVDQTIEEEILAMNQPTEVELPQYSNPEWTTELVVEPDAFLAEEYIQPEPVISYKYKFDKKFYDTPEWRRADF